MSHRALVAVARADGRFDVYLARDGASDDVLERLRHPGARLPPGFLGGPPLSTVESMDRLLAGYLDPIEHEALLVVNRDGSVTPHVVLPFVIATADGLIEGEPPGAVLSLGGRDGSSFDPRYVRGWLQGTAGLLGEAVDCGLLSPDEAFGWLDDAVARLAGECHDLAVIPGRR